MRLFLHLVECGEITRDEEGRDFTDMAAAREAAIKAARDVMCHEIKAGALCLSCHVEIAKRNGSALEIVRFVDAIALSGLPGQRGD